MARPRIISLLLGLLTLLIYLPVWENGFISYDDPEYLVENRIVQSGLTWPGVQWAFTTWHIVNWHPLTWLSHMLDCTLFGPEAGAHHFMSVLIHAINVILLFRLWHRLTGDLWPAAFVAALFAWHPLHVESVAWAAERKDVLSTLFGILAIDAYARYVAASRGDGKRQLWFYGAALFLFALSLLAKPMLVTLPFLLLLLDWWPLQRLDSFTLSPPGQRGLFRRLVAEKIPFLLLTVGSCVMTFLAQSGGAVVSVAEAPLGLRFANAIVAYQDYLVKMLRPLDLAVIYPLPPAIPLLRVIVAAAVLVGITAGVVWRRKPFLWVGWLWYLGTLVPVIGLVQVGSQAMADRYTYVPLIGIFVMLAWEMRERLAAGQSQRVVGAIATVVLLACLFLTYRQVGYWRNSETLFAHAIQVTPENPLALTHLAGALARKGEIETAVTQYEKSLQLGPNQPAAHNNLANLLNNLGRTNEALAHYEAAHRLDPQEPTVVWNLGLQFANRGRYDEAFAHLKRACELAPGNPRPFFLKGRTHARLGQARAAAADFEAALRLDPDHLDSLVWLARLLAANAEAAMRDGPTAVKLAERANALSGGKSATVLDTLAMAYAESGRFSDAKTTTEQAIALLPPETNQAFVAELKKRLALYQSGQPYRERAVE